MIYRKTVRDTLEYSNSYEEIRMQQLDSSHQNRIFSGNIFIFQAFDIGEDINLELVRHSETVLVRPLVLSKYFKNYHTPLPIDLPHPHDSSKYISSKLHSFGVISLAYKIPFNDTLENVRKRLVSIDYEFQEQGVIDAGSIFKAIKRYVKHPKFFHLRTSYVVIQIDSQPENLSVVTFKDSYAGLIASLLRFETENLSEYQKDEILASALGYYREDLFVIDTQAALVYDDEYEEILDLFEFANIQQLELQYFDRMLDQQLNTVYQQEVHSVPIKAYLPFIGSLSKDLRGSLGELKVEISVIIERLESSIKIAGEEYISEIYSVLVDKLDLQNWKESIDKKLTIIKDINAVYQNRVDSTREDLLSVLIIVLIFTELIVGIMNYFK